MDNAVRLPAPLPAQVPILESAAGRKVVRCGRRFGKSRLAMIAGIAGHGPGPDGDKQFPGVLQGRDIVWVAQDYPNLSTVMWREEFVPRFRHLPFVSMNANEHFIAFDGLGTLFLRPETAIGGIRGIGKNLGGVILDEAAFYDLEGALKDVIMPALLDNNGWLLIMSTTNAGPDGNAAKRVPSYFNVVCNEIRAGQRNEEWQEFTGTAFDNPRLNRAAIDELIAEYAPDSPNLKQEVYAELLQSGVGLALPNLTSDDHIVRRRQPARNRRQWGALDWGFNHPWVFGWYEMDEDGNVCKVDTLSGREELPDQIAAKIKASGAPLSDKYFVVHAGHDIWQAKGKAVGYTGPTIAEVLSQHGIKLVRAGVDRVGGLDNLRRYIAVNPVSEEPRFTFMDTDGNRACLAQMQGMQLDPKNMEDALKVDADSAGRGGDDFYDETRYGLMARPIVGKALELPVGENPDISLGYDYKHHRPATKQSADEVVSQLLERTRPSITANRYGVPRR